MCPMREIANSKNEPKLPPGAVKNAVLSYRRGFRLGSLIGVGWRPIIAYRVDGFTGKSENNRRQHAAEG